MLLKFECVSFFLFIFFVNKIDFFLCLLFFEFKEFEFMVVWFDLDIYVLHALPNVGDDDVNEWIISFCRRCRFDFAWCIVFYVEVHHTRNCKNWTVAATLIKACGREKQENTQGRKWRLKERKQMATRQENWIYSQEKQFHTDFALAWTVLDWKSIIWLRFWKLIFANCFLPSVHAFSVCERRFLYMVANDYCNE